jgi:hypothetical protein
MNVGMAFIGQFIQNPSSPLILKNPFIASEGTPLAQLVCC